MKRAFHLPEQFTDIVQREAWPKVAEIAGGNLERLLRRTDMSSGQTTPQRLVDGITERTAGSPSFGLEPCGNIVIQREGRSHPQMLWLRHHDVKPKTSLAAVRTTRAAPGQPTAGHSMGAAILLMVSPPFRVRETVLRDTPAASPRRGW